MEYQINQTRRKILGTLCLMSFSISVAFAQVQVKGTVTDLHGEGMMGASVTVKGGKQGTITDMNGNFLLDVPSKKSIIVVSFIGYKTVEQQVDTQKTIRIPLSEDNKVLEEMVVVGYGSMKKRDLSGAVSQVKADDLLKGNPASSINQALQGKIAGVMVNQNDGAPGGGINIQIRGINSFGSSSQPLYIVDGVPFESGIMPTNGTFDATSVQPEANALGLINPHDIESIEILKDASATAIYGSRGANGVVLITTKRGKQGRAKIEFSSNFSTSNVIKHIDMLDSYTYANYINEEYTNDELYHGVIYNGAAFGGVWKYEKDNDGKILKATYNPKPEDFLHPGWYKDDLGHSQYIEGTDWQDRIFQTGWTQEYNLQVSGASDKGWFSYSGNYLNQEGTIKNSGYNRLTLRANIGQKVTKNIELGLNMNVSRANSDFAKTNNNDFNVLRSALFFNPTIYYGDNSTQIELRDLAYNPYTYVTTAKDQLKATNIFASSYAEVTFTDWLKFRQNLGMTYYFNERNYYYNRDTGEGKAPGINGRGGWSDNNGSYFTSESMLTFNKTFHKIHSLNAVIAFTLEQSNWQGKNIGATQFPTDATENYDMGAALLPDKLYTGKSRNSLMSYLGRVNYVLMDRYIFTASFRRDGSSKFKNDNRFSNFASGAFAWRISEEPLVKRLNVFDNLKLRLSFGQTGNQAIGDYATLYMMNVANYPLMGNEASGYASAQAYNERLKWETTDQYNVGLDFGFLNSRLNFTAEYYHKKTHDLLQQVKIPLSSGYRDMQKNFGYVVNDGLEFSANFQTQIAKQLDWKIEANLSFNRNRIGGLEGDQFATRLWYTADNAFIQRNGLPIGAIYGYVEDGFYDNEAEVRMDKQYANAEDAIVKAMVGEVKYRDLDGDGNITSEKDMTIIGNTNPDYTFGITNTFHWKGWDFGFFIQGVEGCNVFNGNLMAVEMAGGNNIPRFAYNSRWMADNTTLAKWPKATNQLKRSWKLSNRYVEDGAYIRLKNINLGYTFKKLPFAKWIENLHVYASATNLLTFTNYSWYDPDVNAFGGDSSRRGIDIYSYPTSKTFSLGVKLEF